MFSECFFFFAVSFGKIVDNNQALQFLHSMGHTVSKKALMESELQILKGLDFKLHVPNPLTYVEILLEVLGKSTQMSSIVVVCLPDSNYGRRFHFHSIIIE